MVRFGLAGVGVHGARYAAHLLRGDVRGACLGAISRRDVREGSLAALAHNLVFAADPRELATLAGLDAVVVCLPPDLHPEVAIACLEAGRPVIVEKPMAPTSSAAEALAGAAARTGTPLLVAQTLRFDPLIVALKREAASLGAIRLVAINQRFEPAARDWIDTPGRGGVILNTGVHAFDLLRFLTGGEIVSIRATAASKVTRKTEDEFAAIVRIEPGGILATIDNVRTTAGRTGRIEIVCERGQLRADHIHRELARIERREIIDLGPFPEVPTVVEALSAFVTCLAAGLPMPVTAEDGLAAVRAVEACYRALSA